MSRTPDIDFTEQGRYPEWAGKKILRVWKIDPRKCSVMEIEGRKFVLVVSKDAIGSIPYGPYLRDFRLKGFVYTADDMWVIKQHAPRWAKEWEAISSEKGSDSPPYWYVEKELLAGNMAFRHSYDVEKWLSGNGWKKDKIGDGFWLKKVGRGMVRLHGASMWSDEIKLYAYASAKTRSSWGEYGSPELEAKEKEFDEQTSRTLKIEGSYGKDLEDKAREVSQAVNSYRPAPVKRVRTDEDKAALAAFLSEAREGILDYLKTEGQNEYTGKWNEGRTTRWLSTLLLWDTGGMELYDRHFLWSNTYTKRDVGKVFSKLLKQMEAEGLIKQYRDGPQPEWFKLASVPDIESVWFSTLPYSERFEGDSPMSKYKSAVTEWPSQEAMEKHLRDHPKADKSQHVVERDGGGSEDKDSDGEKKRSPMKKPMGRKPTQRPVKGKAKARAKEQLKQRMKKKQLDKMKKKRQERKLEAPKYKGRKAAACAEGTCSHCTCQQSKLVKDWGLEAARLLEAAYYRT